MDDLPFGGTCALRGCDPKKVLVGAADLVAWSGRMQEKGARGRTDIDWPALMRFKRTFTDPVPTARLAAFEKAGIATFPGQARFASPERLVVGDETLESRHFLIAAGSVDAGRAIVLFACACMVGAGAVLFVSSRRFARSASIQALPPLVAIVAMLVLK